jgi:hypothetical protein
VNLNDPRNAHGTIYRYKYAGCRCQECSRGHYRYEKHRRWLQTQGRGLTVPATGFRRRVQALMALGWYQMEVAQWMGVSKDNLNQMMRTQGKVRRRSHDAMVEVYEAHAMTVPPDDPGRQRARRYAAKQGWAPPLAWDDIDNPQEVPNGHKPVGSTTEIEATRLAELEHFLFLGYDIEDVARALRATRDGLEKWCSRHGHADLYLKLAARAQQSAGNQHTRQAS